MRPAVLLVALLVAVAVVADRPQAERGSRRDGRLTVIVGESGESGPSPRLIVMDADGENARVRLGYVVRASLSPDGRSIAYDGLGTRDARVVAAEGPLRDRVLVRNGGQVDWSPTGGAIAFVRGADVWVQDLRSRTQRRVVRNGERPDWSPDAKQLAFVRWRTDDRASSSAADVWMVDLASGKARRLIRRAVDPRWSPDGGRLAFNRYSDVGSSIYVARADGSAQRRVAEADSAAWSPDGAELALADFRRVIRVRPDGSHRRVVYAPKGGCPACRDLDWVR